MGGWGRDRRRRKVCLSLLRSRLWRGPPAWRCGSLKVIPRDRVGRLQRRPLNNKRKSTLIRLDFVVYFTKMLGQVAASDTTQQQVDDLVAFFVLDLGAALGTTLRDLGLLLRPGRVSVFGVKLGMACFGFFSHAPEGGPFRFGELVPVSASNAGDIAIISLDALQVIFVP